MTQTPKYAIIVAGGKGLRMGTVLPKQFLLLNGKPLLMHTLNAFYQADPEIRLILVLPEAHFDIWKEFCRVYKFELPHSLVAGGATRFDSVKNGLRLVEGNGLVAVHDGVRPLVSKELIDRCYDGADTFGAVVPVAKLTDTIRKVDGDSSMTVSRDDYRLVQTPQTFQAGILRDAYSNAKGHKFTDDASVVEAAGIKVRLVEGSHENIKVTLPADLQIAEVLIKNIL